MNPLAPSAMFAAPDAVATHLAGLRAATDGQILNMSTGPVHVSARVLNAQLGASLSSHAATFWDMHRSLLNSLSALFETKAPVLAIHGSIRMGIDLCFRNLLLPNDKVLVVCNGFWGEFLADNASEYTSNVVRLRSSDTAPFPPQSLRAALEEHPDCQMVVLVHVETSTGIRNDIAALSEIVKSSNALLFVDAACSVGCMPYKTDEWGIDIGAAGSHKTIGSVAGLALITLSQRAKARVARAKHASTDTRKSRLRDLAWLYERCMAPGEAPSFTHSTPLILALQQAVLERLEPGLDNWHNRCLNAAQAMVDELRRYGLAMVTDAAMGEQDRSALAPTVTAIALPHGVDESLVRRRLEEVHGIFVIGGVGRHAGQCLRVGLMSPVQMNADNYLRTAACIVETIRHFSTR